MNSTRLPSPELASSSPYRNKKVGEFLHSAPLLVALSGGADSVALLHTLVRIRKTAGLPPPYGLCAAHLHHGIRGADADADLAFCQELCRSLEVPFHFERADIPSIAKASGESLEMAARRVRHSFLLDCAKRLNCRAIALAHHLDDQSEGFFLRLARGAGLRALSGMRFLAPSADPDILLLRPFLRLRHSELIAFLKEENLPWREDLTNQIPDTLRNRVRLHLAPAIENTLGSAFWQTLSRTQQNLADDADCLDALAAQFYPLCVASDNSLTLGLQTADFIVPEAKSQISNLKSQISSPLTFPAIRTRIASSWLLEQEVDPALISRTLLERLLEALNKTEASELPLSKNCAIRIEQHEARIIEKCNRSAAPAEALYFRIASTPSGFELLPENAAEKIPLTVEASPILEKPRRSSPLVRPLSCTVQADNLLGRRLCLRPPHPGERFDALVLPKPGLVSDILTHLKVPASQRSEVLVLADADAPNSNILWLPGYSITRDLRAEPMSPLLRLSLLETH